MNETSHECFVLPSPQFASASARRLSNLATASMNAFTAPFAVMANLLTIYVIVSKPPLHTPSNVLLASLAFSDFLVGLIVQPCYIAYRIIETKENYVPCSLRIVYSESFWVCYGVSFVTLSAISIERFIALRLHLRYNELVTVRRVLAAALAIWLIDISCTSLEWISWDKLVRKTHALLWPCCLIATCVAHVGIFRILQRHQNKICSLAGNQSRERHQRYKRQARLAINAAYLVGIYIACNLPVLIVTAYAFFAGTAIEDVSVFSWTETVAFLNSSISPVVCWWRNYGIRRGVRNALGRVSCFGGGVTRRNSGSFPRGAPHCGENRRELRTLSLIRRSYAVDEGRVSQNYQA